ncbi:MAG: E3 binding domain-containing protein [Deinococcus sp.]|nr:E3 binding domain-containing protein [Deinococcus sp.]
MDNISPLAKTLAESNGIDWRAIQGSGAGGQIVEQDIINYLTRVMSGEEEPPATPVDLPPPDWTGEELPAGMSAEMLSQAGVESDIAALVNQAPLAQAPAGQAAAAYGLSSGQGDQLEEDEFELDLEDEAAEAAPAPTPQAEVAAATGFTPAPAPTPAAPAASGGLGGLLSQLYQAPAAQPSTTPAPEPQTPVASAPAAAYGQPSGFSAGYGRSSAGSEQVTPAAAPEAAEPAYAQAEATQPTVSDAPPFTDEQDAAPVEQVAAVNEGAVDEDVAAPATQGAETEGAVAEVAETAALETAPAPQAPAEPERQPEPEVQPQPAAAAVQAAPAGRPEQAVWFGVYLRRDADVQAAASLREQLNAALGQDVPLSLLVARAAQQHAGLLNLNAVAIQDVHSQRARSVGDSGASLRDALSALDRDHGGQPDLLVVNAGTFELDELHYPGTVTLSLGRVVDGRAALSLNGEVDTAQAAEFLAAVAGSLEAPVALII